MNYSEIETFLELVRTRNITKAAEQLYVSQSAVSNRLKNLENELGFQLILRSRGRQSVEITPKGAVFIPLAERWKILHEETNALRNASFSKLHIAANESSYYTKIAPFLMEYGTAHPELRFSVQICDSEIIYDLVDKGLADFGFASYEADCVRLQIEEIDCQKLVIISSTELPVSDGFLEVNSLDPQREIRFSGGHFSSMELLRERHLINKGDAALTINAAFGTLQHFRKAGFWCICPLDMALCLKRQQNLYIYHLADSLEPWRAYMVNRREYLPDQKALYEGFATALREFIALHQYDEREY